MVGSAACAIVEATGFIAKESSRYVGQGFCGSQQPQVCQTRNRTRRVSFKQQPGFVELLAQLVEQTCLTIPKVLTHAFSHGDEA